MARLRIRFWGLSWSCATSKDCRRYTLPGAMQSVCVLMTIILQFLVNPQTLRQHQNYYLLASLCQPLFDIKELLMNVSKNQTSYRFISTKNRGINKNKVFLTQEISNSKRNYITGINNKSKFSWDKHVDRILNKISSGICQ